MKRLLLCAALLAWSGLASAVVYKWVDAQGKLQYGDRPPDGVHAEVVELLGTHPAASTRTAAPSKPIASSTAAPVDPNDAKTANDKREISQDVDESRDKECTDAQDRYKKLIEGRKIYKT